MPAAVAAKPPSIGAPLVHSISKPVAYKPQGQVNLGGPDDSSEQDLHGQDVGVSPIMVASALRERG